MKPLIDVASLYVLEQTISATGASSIWETTESWDVPEPQLENWLKQTADGIAKCGRLIVQHY